MGFYAPEIKEENICLFRETSNSLVDYFFTEKPKISGQNICLLPFLLSGIVLRILEDNYGDDPEYHRIVTLCGISLSEISNNLLFLFKKELANINDQSGNSLDKDHGWKVLERMAKDIIIPIGLQLKLIKTH